MRRTIFFLFVSLLFPLLISAQGLLADQCDEKPVFVCAKNGNASSLDDFVSKRFVYPKDQILANFKEIIGVKMIINSDGNVIEPDVTGSDITESARKEMQRILSKTVWKPAKIKGAPVSAWYYAAVKVVDVKNSSVPQNVLSALRKAQKYLYYDDSEITGSTLQKRIKTLGNFYERFPLIIEANIPYSKMLSSNGDKELAHDVILNGLKNSKVNKNVKSDIFGHLLSAAHFASKGNVSVSKEEFAKTISIVDSNIGGGSLGKSIIQEDRAYKDRHYRRTIISEGLAAEKTTTDWYYQDKLQTEWSFNKMHKIVGEAIDKGLLNNSIVNLNREHLKNIYSDNNLSNNDFNLLAIRSLVTRLSEGEDMEKAQLISMIADEKVSDKVRKQLQGLYDQVETLKLSKDEIVNNVIMYAPVQDPSKTKEENKAAATEFYRIRDAINNVYHLDWLEKK